MTPSFVSHHQSPLGDSEKPSTAVDDHFLIQQLNWRLDGLSCKTMSCFWTECLALISLDVLEAATRVDMLTTSLVTLDLSSTLVCGLSELQGDKDTGEEG